MPTVLPKQLLPTTRKIHPADLGVMDNRPPSQLSPTPIQLLQEKQMQSILVGMRFSEQELEEQKICCNSSLGIIMMLLLNAIVHRPRNGSPTNLNLLDSARPP